MEDVSSQRILLLHSEDLPLSDDCLPHRRARLEQHVVTLTVLCEGETKIERDSDGGVGEIVMEGGGDCDGGVGEIVMEGWGR